MLFRSRHLHWATDLAETILEQYWDEGGRGFFLTSRDHEPLVTRPISAVDQSIPSGGAAATHALLRLAAYTGRPAYREHAARALTLFGNAMTDNPFGYASMLCALDWSCEGPVEIVIIDSREDTVTRALARTVHAVYLPNRTLTVVTPEESGSPDVPEAARGKSMRDGRPTAYVCKGFTCSAPATTPEALKTLLTAR